MLEELKVLVELQELDSKIYAINKDRERLPRLVALAGEDLKAVEAEAAEAQAEVDNLGKQKRDVEGLLQAENEHLRKLKDRSAEIKTNKEYFAHLKEIEECQKKVAALEESEIELMDKVEKSEAALTEKNAKLSGEQAKFEENKARIEKSFGDGVAKLEELTAQRVDYVGRVTKPVLEYYQQMLSLYPDSVVVEAVAGNCAGCRMTLPPQVYNNVRKGETIIKCYNCRRILYFKDAEVKV